ncbi:hypothetical protein CDD83_1777 [Cordyceps sp. RAO-2017]|nr:hypothetical protein CDD83_1777 [Cordyceps sp. RAO-2017]
MDSESKRPGRDGSRRPSNASDSDSDSDSSDSGPRAQPTEWLATTRQRRSTAGNRMKSMLANEEPDSDLELLFAEDENDQGFSDAGDDASDVQMDSSDDDDDDDDKNSRHQDDMEGEKELERQAKERRAAQRKRKARDAIPAKFRKKVRIDPTTPAAPAPRPKKKSERASWLPSPADLPTRASSRQTTRLSKEQLHQQMVEREERRLKQLALMQKKAARLEATKKPPMTQQDRLAEAAIVEKRNSKSLNRWEEAEKQREEERRAKLAALNNRTLKGPVITLWSGVRQWKDALDQHVTIVEAKPKKKRERADKGSKAKDGARHEANQGQNQALFSTATLVPDIGLLEAMSATATPPTKTASNQTQATPTPAVRNAETHSPINGPKREEPGRLMAMPTLQPPPAALSAPPGNLAAPVSLSQNMGMLSLPSIGRPPEGRPSGVLAAPVLAPPLGMDVNGTRPTSAPKSDVLAPPNTSQHHHAAAPPPPPTVSSLHQERPTAPTTPAAKSESKSAVVEKQPGPPARSDVPPGAKPASPRASETQQPVAEPARQSTTARNAIIYQNFDQNAIRDKSVQTQILFGRKMAKLGSKTPSPWVPIPSSAVR